MIAKALQAQQRFFATGATRSRAFRQQQLKLLAGAIYKFEEDIYRALEADLRKPRLEAFASEIALTLDEIHFAQKNLCRWMRPRRPRTPLALWPGKSRIYYEPRGVALIIGPWNYPLQLALAPLVSAIAAGCCAIVKPSELAPHTAALLTKIITETFAPEFVTVIEGGIPETTELLQRRFDYIFFTGSTKVGQIVYAAAARHLTPVTLELGGKSPAIVTANADLELAARRVAWGKFMNAGQTCVAPDYIYVAASVADKFTKLLQKSTLEFYGANPQHSPSFARIINVNNFRRLKPMLASGRIAFGGEHDEADRYIAPTALREVHWTDPVMSEEIFGPILPILKFNGLENALAEIQTRDKPLAAYFFSNSAHEQKQFIDQLSFGGGCINDCLLHLSNPRLPFGGVGASGIGSYHGERGFLTFSHEKSVIHKSRFFDISLRYPPYTVGKMKWLKRLIG